MATTVIMPKQGNTVEECVLISWKVKEGEKVAVGQIIADIETDKAVFELESPVAGHLLSFLCEEGDTVPVQQNVAVIGTPGEDISDLLKPEGHVEIEAPKTEALKPEIETATARTPIQVNPAPSPKSGISPRAKNLALKKQLDTGAIIGTGPGGRIIERDIALALESVNPMTSLARTVASETGKIAPAAGSGIGERILASDLIDEHSSQPITKNKTVDFEDIPIKGVRKITAERMHESLRETAQLTLDTSVNAQSLLAFRQQLKKNAELLDLASISIGDMVMFAVSRVIQKYPDLNATFQDNVIRRYSNVNLGFACDTPRGLMVPVISNSERLTLNELALAIKDKAGHAKAGTIDPDSLQGGTFTISNLGSLGISSFTPILNYPEVAILGVNAIELKPVREGNEIVYQDHLGLSITINHQVIDGWQAGLFLKDLRLFIENINLLLAQ
jgi:pyruvate dehydrogenase E2 component (dihydrolipoamide acetyltransferase)